jgi:hypothetical protein
MNEPRPSRRRSLSPTARVRLGIGLVLASWFPFAQILFLVADWIGHPVSNESEVRLAIWGIQFVVGLIGLAVAGTEAVQIAHSVGWRQTPRTVWTLFRTPPQPE